YKVRGRNRVSKGRGPGEDNGADPRRFRQPLPVEIVHPGLPKGEKPADPAVARSVKASKMTELVFRDDAYARSCSARVTAADERGIRLDRTVFYPNGGGQPGDTGMLRLPSGETIAIVDTIKGAGPDEVIHVPAPGSPLPAVGTAVT